MIHLSQFCCICFDKGQKLEKISMIQENCLSYHEKLSMLIPQMGIDEIKEIVYICEECKVCIDFTYNFRNKCLNNKKILWQYISQLRLEKNCESVDSIVLDEVNDGKNRGVSSIILNRLNRTETCKSVDILNRLNEIETRKSIDDLRFNNLEKIDIKNEFDTINGHIYPRNELYTKNLSVNYKSSNIKQEIDVYDEKYNKNNSVINTLEDIEKYENVEIKNEDILSLHTEINIGIKNDVSDHEIEDNMYLGNMSENNDSNDDVSVSNKIETNKSSENTIYGNNSINNNFYPGDYFENNKRNKSLTISELKIYNNNGVYTGKRLYECDKCNKTFSSSSYLKVHNRLHTGEKPYKCEICYKFFTNSSDLVKHSRTHTGEKPYKCKICNRSFTRNSVLKRHSKLHINV